MAKHGRCQARVCSYTVVFRTRTKEEIEEEDAVRPKQFAKLSIIPSKTHAHTSRTPAYRRNLYAHVHAARTHPKVFVVVPSSPSAGFVHA